MDVKDKTRAELDERVDKLERLIARKGVGSRYLKKMERIQRDVNIALLLSAAAGIVGLSAWAILKSGKEKEGDS